MAISKKLILELINDLPEEKIGKVISFIKFVKEEEDFELVLESDDEEEIVRILEEDEWYSTEEVNRMLKDKQNE